MLQEGILNPQLNDLLSRIRHTNTLVIADWAFPYWNDVEIVDLSLTRGIPLITNPAEVITQYNESFDGFKGLSPGIEVTRLPHNDFKKLVPNAIGLVRTGDPTAYGNVILESV